MLNLKYNMSWALKLVLYKWKNHFYEMKGDVGMSLHEKERNKKMPTPRLFFHSFFAPRARRFMHADNAPLLRTCNARVCYGVVQCLPVKSPTIYRRNLRREKNDRLVSVHISIDSGYVW